MKYQIKFDGTNDVFVPFGERELWLVASRAVAWGYGGKKVVAYGDTLLIDVVPGKATFSAYDKASNEHATIKVVCESEAQHKAAVLRNARQAEAVSTRKAADAKRIGEILDRLNGRVPKQEAKTAIKTPEPPKTWRAFMIEASDIFKMTEVGFVAKDYAPRELPKEANRFLGGILGDKFDDIFATEALCFNNGEIINKNLSAAKNWPLMLVHFDLYDVEKAFWAKKAKEEGKTFDSFAALDEDSASWKLWQRLLGAFLEEKLEGLTINIGGTKFKFLLQSAAMMKGGKARVWMVREDLYDKAYEAVRHGINEAAMREYNPVKWFVYRGLVMTGCANVVKYREFMRFWNRAIVVKDIKTVSRRNVLKIGKGGPSDLNLVEVDIDQVENDGCSLAREAFFKELHRLGLAADKFFCQFRAPYMKGMVAKAPLPTNGIVFDVYGVEHKWADVDWVIPLSVFKGFPGYESFEAYKSFEPAFGFMQPAANARTTNGQFLDTLMLSQEEHVTLGRNNINRFARVAQSVEDFNDEAMLLGLKSLCLEGFTPESFAAMSGGELADKIRNKVADWERGMRKRANTAHYVRSHSRNLYLLPDLQFFADSCASGDRADTCLKAKGVDGRKYDEVCCLDLPEGLIVLSRNPIAFAGEVVVVMNVKKTWGLHGCCHLAAKSRLCNLLSGADFDGDQIFASGDGILVQIVAQKQIDGFCGVELYFDKKELGIEARTDDIAWATFCEMQNHSFEQAAQCGARVCEPTNAVGPIEWRWQLCAFFSAYMQVGVDAGKYCYVLPKEWTRFMGDFLSIGYRLPGWKYSKAIDKEKAAAISAVKANGIKAGETIKATDERVAKYLCDHFALCNTPAVGGGYLVYDAKELIPSVVGGEIVKISCNHFDKDSVAEVAACAAGLYKDLFAIYGRKAVDAANAEDPHFAGDDVPEEEESTYAGGDGADVELFPAE